MQLKRISDNWIFSGMFADYEPPKARAKVNEISIIRGASRFQSLGSSGTVTKFTLRFDTDAQAHDFLSKYDAEYEFTDESGIKYKGVFKDDPEIKKYGVRNLYDIKASFYSMGRTGVGS